LDAGGLATEPANQSSYKLNEHGPALNVFWSRSSGMGARVFHRKDPDKDGEAFKIKKKKAKAFPDPALEPDG